MSKIRQTLEWVILARRLDLAPKALALDAVARQLRGQRLQGDRAAQGAVLGLVHLAGPPGAQEAHDPVATGDQIAARECPAPAASLPLAPVVSSTPATNLRRWSPDVNAASR